MVAVVLAGVLGGGYALLHRTTPATWYLPEGYEQDASSSMLEVLVYQVDCASGESADGNTAPPRVKITPDAVLIDIRTYVHFGSANCLASPLSPLTVDIGEPLGNRVLVDLNGSVIDNAESIFPDVTVPQSG